jgi:tetratricopeptide (TPR) repeat protein
MVLLIFGLVLAIYWPALRGAMLWDDPAHVPRPDLQSWQGLGRIWTDLRATQQYYPVLFSAFWVEHLLWGDNTLGYHLVNVVFHTLSCCLLALLLRRLWGPAWSEETPGVPAGAEWFAAALFAVHPVCVESVAWITEQKNTLSLVFYLLAALAYLNFAASRKGRAYALATALFLCALGSKTVTVTLPVALLVVLWWKQGGLRWRRDAVPLLPWFGLSLASGLLTSWIERHIIGADVVAFDLTVGQRVLLAGRVLWFYVGKLIWPVGLNFFYPKWDVAGEAAGWAGYLLAAVAVTVGLWALRRQLPGALAAWLVYGAGLFPILGFFKVFFFGFTYVNDHFQYLPAISLLAAATGGVAMALASAPRTLRIAGVGLGVGVLGVLAVAAHGQSRLYRDNETLSRAVIAHNPAAWMARQILATTLAKAPDRHAEAMAEFQEVMRLKPDYPDAHVGLGVELARLPGRRDEAIAQFERTIELSPYYPEAHNNLALALSAVPGHAADVIAHYEAALRARPDYPEAHANLADVLAKFPDRVPEAMAHYQEALRLRPGFVAVHCRLAFLLSRLPGKQDEALAQYAEALRLDPNYIDAHNGLAIAYVMMGRPADARHEWQTVLRLDPAQESARHNLRRLDEMEGR